MPVCSTSFGFHLVQTAVLHKNCCHFFPLFFFRPHDLKCSSNFTVGSTYWRFRRLVSLGYKSPSAPRVFASLREKRSLFRNFRSNSPRRPVRHFRNCCATHLELCEAPRAAVLYLVRTSACNCTQKQSCPPRHAPFTAGTLLFRLREAKKIFLAEKASSPTIEIY